MSVVPGLIPRPHRPGLGEARTGARALSAVSLHNVPSWENVSPLGTGKQVLMAHRPGLGENAWNKNLAWEKGREAPIKLPAETSGHVSPTSHEFLPSRDVVQKKQGERLRMGGNSPKPGRYAEKQGERLRIGRISPKPRRCARKRVEWLLAGRASPKPGRCAQGWQARRRALTRLVERTDFAGQASPPGFPPPCHRCGVGWGVGAQGSVPEKEGRAT